MDEVEMAHGGSNARTTGMAVAEPPTKPATSQASPKPLVRDASPATDVPNLSAAIYKGEGRAPFMISSESQREVVQGMRWKCAACIWGGPILTLASVYFLLMYFGWA
jgi:hypothetical protein